ncbi:phytanoyl-CoA dioxygenase family protein [Sandaracinobacteroides saxicola]|uniref:Phytanoyl-CoA dioxygenase family protein n=2 Tax=Sandaracinobacteroides saxicola TaxID=2759707 RepID=A0A7G5IMZ8_9SPHN|nr:phytanoyl-CoA dioxygenase family protein [Sandaracinobacteroides saxicola]
MTLAADYARDGYVVVQDVLTPAEIDALRKEATAIATGGRGAILGAEAFAGRGEAALPEILAIHFPHKASPLMAAMLAHPAIVALLTQLVGPDVKAMQSMLFVKSAGKPGQAWHQDEHYIPTRDRSLCGVWIALDDATPENGCLWMRPGSHHDGILWPVRDHGDPRFDNGQEAHGFPGDREEGVPVPVRAGGVALFNGYTLHRSLDNRAPGGFRRALVNHYMSARSLLPWAFGIPPTLREDYRDIVLVAGDDPYAWKGREDISFPFVRPENPAHAAALFGRLRG